MIQHNKMMKVSPVQIATLQIAIDFCEQYTITPLFFLCGMMTQMDMGKGLLIHIYP